MDIDFYVVGLSVLRFAFGVIVIGLPAVGMCFTPYGDYDLGLRSLGLARRSPTEIDI